MCGSGCEPRELSLQILNLALHLADLAGSFGVAALAATGTGSGVGGSAASSVGGDRFGEAVATAVAGEVLAVFSGGRAIR